MLNSFAQLIIPISITHTTATFDYEQAWNILVKKHGLTPILSSFQELKVGVTLDGAKLSKFCSFIMCSIKLLDCRMVDPLKGAIFFW